MAADIYDKQHLRLGSNHDQIDFTSPSGGGGGDRSIPELNRAQHGARLLENLQEVRESFAEFADAPEAETLEGPLGIQVEFLGLAETDLNFMSLSEERSKNADKNIELLNVVDRGDRIAATVFVPEGKLDAFEKKINDYLVERTNKNGDPLDNKTLINTIDSFKRAAVKSLWTDDEECFPDDEDAEVRFELWLATRGSRERVLRDFRNLSTNLGIPTSNTYISFPERTVLLARCSVGELSRSTALLNCIAEIRLAKETASFYDALSPQEQREWADDLLERTVYDASANVRVCSLDTGVLTGHPLLSPAITGDESYTVDLDWGSADEDGHGTEVAGLIIYGDMSEPLTHDREIYVGYSLESVKILRSSGDNQDEPYGQIFAQGVSLPEIENPESNRIFISAISATDTRDRGRPSAWSSAIDGLSSDSINDGENPRLFIISAGNIGAGPTDLLNYPDVNVLEDIHDPGQSWNALTVGSYTTKTSLDDEGTQDYEILAEHGQISPYTTTSFTWSRHLPTKPDLVMEGGNAAAVANAAVSTPSLSLLTSNYNFEDRLFSTTRATSASAALLARMAARLQAEYPDLRPESIRGLLVQSADWPPELRRQFGVGSTERQKIHRVMKCSGYGVPSFEKARASAENSLCMILEEQIQPFYKSEKNGVKTNVMNLHNLPWPKDLLLELGAQEIRLVVTLSYFVEPNPAARGVGGKYSYPSHSLRFGMKRSGESVDKFVARINAAERSPDNLGRSEGSDSRWVIGSDTRHQGSLHKDIWVGSAADLAEKSHIAVYPAQGWWRTRNRLQKYENSAHYSLIISIEAPAVDVDIYSAVENLVRVPVEIAT